MLAGVGPQHFQRARADAARRQVHDTLERRIVVAVRDQAQVRQRVLDLLALEEPQAAVHPVRNARREQVFLEHPRLRVRTVEDGVVGALAAARDPLADLPNDELGLVALVVGAEEADRRALALAGPEFLADAAAVVADDGVGGIEDVAGRAVVLLEPEQLHVVEIPAVLLQVLDPRAAPAVDRLVVVAHHVRDAGRADQCLHPVVLDGVGVLELVDQHVPEARTVVFAQARHLTQDLVAAQQQLGEVDHAIAAAGVFVRLVQLDQLAAGRIAVVLQVLRPQAFVFLRVDEPRHFTRHPARVVQVQAADDLLDQALLVLTVEDLEALRQAGLAPVQAQQAVADAVEGADPERRGRQAELRLDAVAHLGRGLVGERHGEDAMRRHALDLDQPFDAVGQHARLATARAGQHEGRQQRGTHGLPLRVVERRKNVGNVHRRVADSTGLASAPGASRSCRRRRYAFESSRALLVSTGMRAMRSKRFC